VADNIIQIKRSDSTDTPDNGDLAFGELAYSFSSNLFFIGTSSNTVIQVGGGKYVSYLDHTPGTLTANSAILVDANSHIDNLSVTNLRIQSSGESTAYITEIVNEITSSVANNQIATAWAVKNYVDEIWSANVSITGGTITGVELNNLQTPLDVADGGTGTSSFNENGVAYASNSSILDFLTGSNGEILQISSNSPTFGGIDGGDY
jgi:hypothetical protein